MDAEILKARKQYEACKAAIDEIVSIRRNEEPFPRLAGMVLGFGSGNLIADQYLLEALGFHRHDLLVQVELSIRAEARKHLNRWRMSLKHKEQMQCDSK